MRRRPPRVYFVAGGFVEVGDDKVLVLADYAEPVTGIDVEAARRRMQEAAERLKDLTPEDARYDSRAGHRAPRDRADGRRRRALSSPSDRPT